jgi:hypothetical protein
MKRSTIIPVVALYVIVGGIWVFLHWYAATHAHALRNWYLERYPLNHKPIHAALADLFFPAIILGLGAGCLTAAKPQLELAIYCLALSVGVVALFSVYALFIPTPESQMWDSESVSWRVLILIPAYWKAALMCLFFGAVGRNSIRQLKGLGQDIG